MGMPAARLKDMHICPKFTGPIPHVGGPILPPCAVTVLIGGLPAARVGDKAFCVAPSIDAIAKGSMTVFIMGKSAARVGDMMEHRGIIAIGMPTVLIGG